MTFYAKRFNDLTNQQVYEILKSRSQIFMLEQNIRCLDMDDVDYKSLHCFMQDSDRIAAYLRAYYKSADDGTVKIGRVLTLEHGKGTGTELMRKSIAAIKSAMNCRTILVDAQKQAVGFYEKCGFHIVSGEFLEEDIPHLMMELEV